MASSLILQGGSATQNSIKESVTQNSHGFSVGNAIRYDVVQQKWVSSRANSAENAEVAGVVSAVADSNTFQITYSGWIDIPQFNGLSLPAMFLSDVVNGGLTGSPPSAIGTVVKPVLVRASSGTGHVVVNYLGTQIGGSSTVAIDEIQPVGTIMPFAGSQIPDTWLECNGVSYSTSTYAELYNRVLYDTEPRVPMYGHVVTLTGVNVSANIGVNDIVQFKNNTSAWSGGLYDSNAEIIGVVLAVTTTTAVVQTLPVYNSTTKTFSSPNVTFKSGNGTGTATGTSEYRFLTPVGAVRGGGGSISFTTTSITHFNTPDMRGRFTLGRNATAQSETLESDTNYSSSLDAYQQGVFGGQESVPTPVTSVGSGSGVNAVAPFANNLMPNMPPFLAVRYIIKAKPYTRAAIIEGIEVPYNQLLVGDIRSGVLRGGVGSGDDLVFRTNTGNNLGTERMRLMNAGRLGIGTNTPGYSVEVVESSTPTIAVRSSATPPSGGVQAVAFLSAHGGSSAGVGSLTNVPLCLYTNGVERARLLTGSSSSLGIGTTGPVTTLSIYNGGESTSLNTFNQALTSAGILIETDYTAAAYTPGIFWSTKNDNNTKPKAGINVYEAGQGTALLFGTSNSYATGLTNNAVKINHLGHLSVGLTLADALSSQSVPLGVSGAVQADSYSFRSSTTTPKITNNGGQTGIEWSLNSGGSLLIKTGSSSTATSLTRITVTDTSTVIAGLLDCTAGGFLVNSNTTTGALDLPIGSIVCVNVGSTGIARNGTTSIYLSSDQKEYTSIFAGNTGTLVGTWRVRGVCSTNGSTIIQLAQRVVS